MPAAIASRGLAKRDRACRRAGARRHRADAAGDDLDQRRLAGAVLAQQRVDRALGEHRAKRCSSALTPGKDLLTPRPRAPSSPAQILFTALGDAHLAPAIDADRPQDQHAQHDLHQEGIDVEQHQGLRDHGHDDDAENGAGDADVAAGQHGAADDRRGEGEDQPVVADRRLADLQARDQADAGERREQTRDGMGGDDRRLRTEMPDSSAACGLPPTARMKRPSGSRLRRYQISDDDERRRHDEPGQRPEQVVLPKALTLSGDAVEGLRLGDGEVDALEDRQRRQRDDEGRDAGRRR